MGKVQVNVGDKLVISGYGGDSFARAVEIDAIKGVKRKLLVCKCLVRSSVATPVFRSYYVDQISKISKLKLD